MGPISKALTRILNQNSDVSALVEAWRRFEQAGAEGRAASFHWENGRFVQPLWIGQQPKRLQARCGARTRAGGSCGLRVVQGKKRCRLHGGASTGPRTAEGRAAIAESNRRRAGRSLCLAVHENP
jgi:hypothetical protein